MGAVVMNGVVAEEDVIIGAGSVVKEDFKIPQGKIVVGNPARIAKDLDEEGKQRIMRGLKYYQGLPERYRKGLRNLGIEDWT
jgi:carbonic anhydrase/acetyltransferase-like protein (isoleucine patch superfamily)